MKYPEKLEHRNQLGDYLNRLELKGVGVEVGSAYGGFARTVLSTWEGRRLFLVDPWTRQPAEVYKERTEHIDYEAHLQSCIRLARFDSRCKLVRAYSVQAAPRFKKNSLDFVYIDGNHCYEAVKEDLEAWHPKVKPGGLFAGHDFYDVTTSGHYCEVKKAVAEWMAEAGLEFKTTECTSWWSRKPR